mmetsp:Transcript_132999/g.384649  ORF Transcript_132999/g.384649 Transcript_132999/m.384649 type:complete len:315 (-) Transcript_132999:74-1018(-)
MTAGARRSALALGLLVAASQGRALQPRMGLRQAASKIESNATYASLLDTDAQQRLSQVAPGVVSMMNYPSWRSPECHGEGGFICDPGATPYMNSSERVSLMRSVWTLRENNLVQCGRLLDDRVDHRHLQPFYLGIAVLPEWPASASGPDSLEHYGQMVSADWNMNQRYVGTPVPRLTCPTSAMLFLMPETGQAYLSSDSCEFICASRGGEEVVRQARAALRNGGASSSKVYTAALAGAEQVYAFLSTSQAAGPLSTNRQQVVEQEVAQKPLYLSEALQRSLFALAILALVGSLVLGLAVILVVPSRAQKFVSSP